MTTAALFLVSASFLASVVETVEALTIVLALGVTREWRSVLIGTGVALVALTGVVAVLGPALTLIPIDALRVFVGTLLLIFGLQWLRKAVLRASGNKALHDEERLYKEHVAESVEAKTIVRAGMDWYAFTVSFKGVFLEGLEVVFIVLTFGTNQGDIGLAAVGAAAAVILMTAVGVIVHKPLSQVPENGLKFAVGGMLTTFGVFWAGEGVGVEWPAGDATILAILVATLAFAMVMIQVLKGYAPAPVPAIEAEA